MTELADVFLSRGYLPARSAPGGLVITEAMLRRLRRQQLADLAYAFDVPANRSGTKDNVLLSCVGALGSGVFERPPKRPEYLRKALLDPDSAKEHPERVDWERFRATDLDTDDWTTLRRLAKRCGVNCFGLSKTDLQEALRAKGAL